MRLPLLVKPPFLRLPPSKVIRCFVKVLMLDAAIHHGQCFPKHSPLYGLLVRVVTETTWLYTIKPRNRGIDLPIPI